MRHIYDHSAGWWGIFKFYKWVDDLLNTTCMDIRVNVDSFSLLASLDSGSIRIIGGTNGDVFGMLLGRLVVIRFPRLQINVLCMHRMCIARVRGGL